MINKKEEAFSPLIDNKQTSPENTFIYLTNNNLNNSDQTTSVLSIQSKAYRLRELALSVLKDSEHIAELSTLMEQLDLSAEKVIEEYIMYDTDIYAYGNEIYDSLTIRMVLHLHNLLKGSWHIERQVVIENLIKIAAPDTLIDIGFGLPTLYVKNILQKKSSAIKITLADFSESAFHFSRALLSLWSSSWEDIIHFKKSDLSDTANQFVGHYDLYMFLDSIEHVPNPTECLKNYVSLSPSSSKFLLSIPIGPIIPAHYMAWDTNTASEQWLNECGLKILKSYEVHINPQVDFFAEQYDFNFHNFMVICSKK